MSEDEFRVDPICIEMPGGKLTNFDDVEKLLHHTFYNELRAAPEEHPVILITRPNTDTKTKEKLTQIFFETFSVPAFYLVSSLPLILMASPAAQELTDESINCIVHSGISTTFVAIMKGGKPIDATYASIPMGGKHVGGVLLDMIRRNNSEFGTTSAEQSLIKHIKETKCKVAINHEASEQNNSDQYELPDGQFLNLGNELFESSEILFHTSDENPVTLPDAILWSISRLDSREEREKAFKSIILSGGNTMLSGFVDRLESELCSKLDIPYPQQGEKVIKIYADPKRNHFIWIGSSILASRKIFDEKWFSKEQYDEHGPSGSVFHKELEYK